MFDELFIKSRKKVVYYHKCAAVNVLLLKGYSPPLIKAAFKIRLHEIYYYQKKHPDNLIYSDYKDIFKNYSKNYEQLLKLVSSIICL